MRLKTFKLDQGKLVYTGIREVQPGDIIVTGSTTMAESTLGNTVQLREGTEAINRANPTRQAEQAKNLEASIRRAHPDYTDEQIRVFIKGR